MSARIRQLIAYVQSREGRHDIGLVVATTVALYDALHRAGVL